MQYQKFHFYYKGKSIGVQVKFLNTLWEDIEDLFPNCDFCIYLTIFSSFSYITGYDLEKVTAPCSLQLGTVRFSVNTGFRCI